MGKFLSETLKYCFNIVVAMIIMMMKKKIKYLEYEKSKNFDIAKECMKQLKNKTV